MADMFAKAGNAVLAIHPGGSGEISKTHLAWKSTRSLPYVSSPLFYKGRFYVVKGEQRPTISRVEPATGKVEWSGELDSRIKIESSPTGADDKIYFQNFRGEVFVVAAAEQFKLLNTIPMGDEGDDQLRSTISVSQGELFIRAGRKLYCVGN